MNDETYRKRRTPSQASQKSKRNQLLLVLCETASQIPCFTQISARSVIVGDVLTEIEQV